MERLFWGWTIAVGLAAYGAGVFWNDPLGARNLFGRLTGQSHATTADGWNVTSNGVRWRIESDQTKCPTATATPEDEVLLCKYLSKEP
jgi:hypothetical protein